MCNKSLTRQVTGLAYEEGFLTQHSLKDKTTIQAFIAARVLSLAKINYWGIQPSNGIDDVSV